MDGTRRDASVSGYVIKSDRNRFTFSPSASEEAVAYGRYLDPVHTVSNYGQLYIATSGQFSDEDRCLQLALWKGG
eukprot:jgi/Botrbrau1/12455/Bobra.0169s0003.1